MNPDCLRVLVVDDAVTFRKIVGDTLARIPGVEVVGVAANGRIALQKIDQLRPDLLTLDLEMPEVDGLEVLRRLRAAGSSVGTIMLSAFTKAGANATVAALDLGAFDFVLKPAAGGLDESMDRLQADLRPKIEAFAKARRVRQILHGAAAPASSCDAQSTTREPTTKQPTTRQATTRQPTTRQSTTQQPTTRQPTTRESTTRQPTTRESTTRQPTTRESTTRQQTTRQATTRMNPPHRPRSLAQRMADVAAGPGKRPRVIALGISTGGPQALAAMMPRLPADLPAPLLIVQHMPPMFTRSLADSLNDKCALAVAEAQDGQPVEPGWALVAPGGRQMKVEKVGTRAVVRITDDPPENSCRPSVDYLFRSVAHAFGPAALAVIMTGMGSDGTLGCRLMKRRGACVIAQDQATCVVYGMPKALIDEGLADVVAPLDAIAEEIVRFVHNGAPVCS